MQKQGRETQFGMCSYSHYTLKINCVFKKFEGKVGSYNAKTKHGAAANDLDCLLLLSELIILNKTRAEEIRRHVDVSIPSKSKQ